MRTVPVVLTVAGLALGACAGSSSRRTPQTADGQPTKEPDSGDATPTGGDGPPPPSQPELTEGGWQTLTVTIHLTSGSPAVVGLDQVRAVLSREEYGPCTTCHARQWPYLDPDPAKAWPRLQAAAAAPGHGVASVQELARKIADCIDQTSEEHCAGDPATADDNADVKMPTKFGYDPVTTGDLALVRAWAEAGAPATSSASEQQPVLGEGTAADGVELKQSSFPLSPAGSDAVARVAVRGPNGACKASVLQLSLLTVSGRTAGTASLSLACDGAGFVKDYRVSAEPAP